MKMFSNYNYVERYRNCHPAILFCYRFKEKPDIKKTIELVSLFYFISISYHYRVFVCHIHNSVVFFRFIILKQLKPGAYYLTLHQYPCF